MIRRISIAAPGDNTRIGILDAENTGILLVFSGEVLSAGLDSGDFELFSTYNGNCIGLNIKTLKNIDGIRDKLDEIEKMLIANREAEEMESGGENEL